MNPRLHRYLSRLEDTIRSRREIEIEKLEIFDLSQTRGRISLFHARLRFSDGSLLQIREVIASKRWRINKLHYAYQ